VIQSKKLSIAEFAAAAAMSAYSSESCTETEIPSLSI